MSDTNESNDKEEKPASQSQDTSTVSPEHSNSNGLTPNRPQASTSSSSSLSSSNGGKHSVSRHREEPRPGPSRAYGKLHHRREKFTANEDYVKQIMDMGICRNGAIKSLYWTGNQSPLAASNWIFDQPDRDLDTPLEDELEMIRAQQAEREREDLEEKEFASHMSLLHHHLLDEEDSDEEDLMDEEDEDEDEEDEEDFEDEYDDMEYKMVFVINKAKEIYKGSSQIIT